MHNIYNKTVEDIMSKYFLERGAVFSPEELIYIYDIYIYIYIYIYDS